MHFFQILILAIIQGAAEMLPISSSAHVTIAAKLMGFNRGTSHQWAFLLIMLHTGNMLAVLIYFRSRWKSLWKQAPALIAATVATLGVGGVLYVLIKRFVLQPGQDIEELFTKIPLIAAGLATVGVVILVAAWKDRKNPGRRTAIGYWPAIMIGAVQGIALPWRGLSRSGSTISTGMFFGIDRMRAEEFSFALAVLLTPVLIAYEARKLVADDRAAVQPAASRAAVESGEPVQSAAAAPEGLKPLILPSLAGMAFSFFAGLLALRWLSAWLERGRWHCFGLYCLVAAAAVLAIHFGGG